ncbi:hypothetical protein P7K49_005693 [Saguinus oedipus]|uniref:Helicase C-terminal domain-containing protein n=1 Tax=Saguinus oedipus TaxID=9490 RepID=A0ABQ9W095_SAGOE|nr:hypothetical protein P7K49_005693 [Saguinus oedipus]
MRELALIQLCLGNLAQGSGKYRNIYSWKLTSVNAIQEYGKITLQNKVVIKKLDVRKYEENLKAELTNWIKNGKAKQVKRVLENLSPDSSSSSKDMVNIFPLLVEKLRQMDKLPAIFFLFKNGDVEKRAGSMCAFLEKTETKSHPHTECHRYILDINEELRKVKRIVKEEKTIIKKNQKRAGKLEGMLMDRPEYINFLKKLNAVKISEGRTYADVSALHSEIAEENGLTLNTVLKRVQLTRRGEELTTLAQSGIGYHHSAMYFKERELVEILFAKGLIRVVTATEPFALGIHTPCKSVVFAQDSVYLDALNYRQMSGRAGRRGQDLLGDVYFFDIPLPKIKRLIASNVPELRGQFPLSITLVLRLMMLASKKDDPEDAKAKFLIKEVILADLPEDFKAALHEYNLAVMKDFASFLLTASKSHEQMQTTVVEARKILQRKAGGSV